MSCNIIFTVPFWGFSNINLFGSFNQHRLSFCLSRGEFTLGNNIAWQLPTSGFNNNDIYLLKCGFRDRFLLPELNGFNCLKRPAIMGNFGLS